jgi:hypothetical protein
VAAGGASCALAAVDIINAAASGRTAIFVMGLTPHQIDFDFLSAVMDGSADRKTP